MRFNFDFVSNFRYFSIISLIFFVFSCYIVVTKSAYQLGLEFAGGSLYKVNSEKSETELQEKLRSCGLKNFQLRAGGESLFLLRTGSNTDLDFVSKCLDNFGSVISFENFSPLISDEIKRQGVIAGVLALITMFVYLAVRFEKFFALGACLALAHDVIISLGLYLLLDNFISLQALVGALTLVGYSVNDTIIVFDRIREELNKEGNLKEIFNKSINATLGRSVKTSFITLVSVVVIWFFGQEAIVEFASYFLIGIIVGTYSSIFVAAPSVLFLLKMASRK
ncbi:MAG: protein translocase subunit SecF [Deltaproteobacteria bacterium]|nr:protein translocase subunit SecF [Deltaproteobacteria bacterium]